MSRHRVSERMARFRKRKRAGFPVVVSEGDSWFSYELFPNIIDLLEDEEMFAHLRLETSGDTVANMVGDGTPLDSLRDIVQEEEALFLLFSGGGNDMQNHAKGLFQDGVDPEDCLVPDVSDRLFSTLRTQIEELIKSLGPTVPVVTHGYDYFQPCPEPLRMVGFPVPIGPWFYPEMTAVNITDPAKQRALADLMVDRFNDDLAALKTKYPKDFVYIDLRRTLDPENEWENEIHPTRDGFRKVKDKMLADISKEVRALLIDRQPSTNGR